VSQTIEGEVTLREHPSDAVLSTLEAAVAERDVKLAERDMKLAEQDVKLAEQDVKLAEQEVKIAELTAKVTKLTEALGLNSKNSHLPPSSDGPGANAKGKPLRKFGGKRGGQKGHRGNHRRLLPAEKVDTPIDLFPPACLGCGDPLPETSDADATRHQQLDLRNHRPHLTEWRRHAVKCKRCGATTRAEYDRKKIPSFAFGPCLTAVVVLLTGTYHLSRRKAMKLLQDLFGISVSVGAISVMEKRASKALAPAYAEAEKEVQYAGVKNTDATSWLRDGKLASLWVLATMAATVYRIFDDGCRDTIRPLFGSQTRGILISDRATVFLFWAMSERQICHAHLIRKFVLFSQRNGLDAAVGRDLLDCMKLVFEYWHGYKSGHITRSELQFFMQPLQRNFEQLLERGKKCGSEGIAGVCADILAHKEALWTFVNHEGVEPTNNHGELELRDFVLWRKRSFGTRSERGDRFAERIMTVVRTARKQGIDVLDFLVGSIKASLSGIAAPRLLVGNTT
jgi:transposase